MNIQCSCNDFLIILIKATYITYIHLLRKKILEKDLEAI